MKNDFLVFGVLVGLIVLVGAVAWNPVSYSSPYYFSEDVFSSHNFSANLSDSSDFSHFLILDIAWGEGSVGAEHSNYYWLPWNDSGFTNSTSGFLDVNAVGDNETGNFTINIHAQGSPTGVSTKFNFIINATNDAPDFTNLNSSYEFPQNEADQYIVNATDEESHHPLTFSLIFLNNCTHASWTGRADGENCSIFNLTYDSTSSTSFNFDSTNDDVGVYWANFSVRDYGEGYPCPHVYCDNISYETNKSSGVYLLRFDVYSMLSINVSNCTNAVVTEGEQFNCTINVTTRGEEDNLDFSSYAFFRTNPEMSYDETNRDWFYTDFNDNASAFFYSLPVSINPGKKEVGNWTINFSVQDVLRSTIKTEPLNIFVNFTEAGVSLAPISDLVIYDNYSFGANATDDDLLIWDSSIKDEELTFSSNTSWVSVTSPASANHNINYLISNISINHGVALLSGEGNYSVNISVIDLSGNSDWEVFVVEILNESAPIWNASLTNPVILELVEGQSFIYNVSMNVSDDEPDVISFYYQNVSAEFCSLNNSNFNSNSGIISFVPIDCDVGYHDITIIATDGKKNSSWSFNFSISNVPDAPTINTFTGENSTGQSNLVSGFNFVIEEGVSSNFSLIIDDDDYLIPSGQRGAYYNESLNINITFVNSTGFAKSLFNFSFVGFNMVGQNYLAEYNATLLPLVSQVGEYSVFVNISDGNGNFTNRTWVLNVTANLDAPVLEQVNNFSLTFHDYFNFSLNASDNEDDYNGLNLSYSVVATNPLAPNLSIYETEVFFNMDSNVSYAGKWVYNATATDSEGMIDWQVFWVSVYGVASLVSPVENSSFSLTENVSSLLNFTLNSSVGDSLIYEFWVDNVSCAFQNNSDCNYGNLSLRNSSVSFGNGTAFNWSFTPNFADESYGNLKNLTMRVYPNSSSLNFSQKESVAVNFSFKLNISHTNAPIREIAPIGLLQSDYNSNIDVDLDGYFADEDVSDSYYLQNVTFTKSAGDGSIFVAYVGGWDIQIGTVLDSVFDGFISILGNDSVSSDVIENVQIRFTEPSVTPSPSSGEGGSGASTKLKFYSLRIIMPEDIIISDEDYIEIPFGLENSGEIDLSGIDLSSQVLYNNEFADDVRIDLGETYVDILKPGERQEYSMKIFAETDRSGRYKATIFANVSSPEFDDWGDFFIDLRRTNESEATELLIFTEKLITDNPECLELTEVFRRAKEAFEAGDEIEAVRLAQEVSEACEDAIKANEQVKYRIEGMVESNFYYISFATLSIFLIGFIFYVYKRVRFNKSAEDEYVR